MSQDAQQHWVWQIQRARRSKIITPAVYAQTIRDAHHIGGLTVSQIRDVIGVQDNTQIYRHIRGHAPESVPPTQLPTVALLSGKGAEQDTWDAMRSATRLRGWLEVTDRTSAWHLSRAGATVVEADFTAGMTLRLRLLRGVYQPPDTRERMEWRTTSEQDHQGLDDGALVDADEIGRMLAGFWGGA